MFLNLRIAGILIVVSLLALTAACVPASNVQAPGTQANKTGGAANQEADDVIIKPIPLTELDQNRIGWGPFLPGGKMLFRQGISGGLLRETGEEITYMHTFNYFLYDLTTGEREFLVQMPLNDRCVAVTPDGKGLLVDRLVEDTNGDGQLTSKDNSSILLFDFETKEFTELLDGHFRNEVLNFIPGTNSFIMRRNDWDVDHDGIFTARDKARTWIYDLSTGIERMVLNREEIPMGYLMTTNEILVAGQHVDTNGDGKKNVLDGPANLKVRPILDRSSEWEILGNELDWRIIDTCEVTHEILYLMVDEDKNGDGRIGRGDTGNVYRLKLEPGAKPIKIPCDTTVGLDTMSFTHDGKYVVWEDVEMIDGQPADTAATVKRGVFAAGVDGEVKTIVPLARGCHLYSVFPNSSRALVFSGIDYDVPIEEMVQELNIWCDLWLVDIETGARRKILDQGRPDPKNELLLSPAGPKLFSPDERYIFISRASDRKAGSLEVNMERIDTLLIDLETGTSRLLLDGSEEIGWSPVFLGKRAFE